MAAPVPSITSEIGRLRSVVVHRPGLELARLTPDTKDALLFDDLLWVERAQSEHDEFVRLLRGHGVEVLLFEDLLAGVLADEAVRTHVIDEAVSPVEAGPHVAEGLRHALAGMPADAAATVLLGGVPESELVESWGIRPFFGGTEPDRTRFVLRPLPNLLFMRDNAAWIGGGLALSVLASPARARESLYVEAVYRHHPRFVHLSYPFWFGAPRGDAYPASLEGGDLLVLDAETLLVGLGARTTPAAVEILARRLFSEGRIRRVVAVRLGGARSALHLDAVFTMVDIGTFNVSPGFIERADVHTLSPGRGGGIDVHPEEGLVPALKRALISDSPIMIPTGEDAAGSVREQWDDGNNTLAISPGVVVAYGRNRETNRRLRDHGVEVLELEAYELCRGRGGPRCMTQPIFRDSVEPGSR